MKKRLISAMLAALTAMAGILYLAYRNREEPTKEAVLVDPDDWVILEPTEEISESTEPIPEPTQPADPLQELLDDMSLEEKVGQLFLARCPTENAASDVAAYHLGGYLLFGQNFDGQTPDSIRSLLSQCQSAAKIPMLMAVDEEGGTVCRISDHKNFRNEKFGAPRDLFRQGGMERVLSEEREKAELLRSLGINVNMAPVCDIADRQSAFLYRRSLGQSAAVTGEFAAQTIGIMASRGVGAVMKHFPGYGNNADTHTGIARDSRTLQELEGNDIQPFFAGIEAGGGAILVSHMIVEAIDPKTSASLSEQMHRYIRLAMGFDGVIVTDDLSMGAITDSYGAGEAAVLAVLAGNDLLCATEYEIGYDAVLTACRENRIPESRLEDAVMHILKWKKSIGLL